VTLKHISQTPRGLQERSEINGFGSGFCFLKSYQQTRVTVFSFSEETIPVDRAVSATSSRIALQKTALSAESKFAIWAMVLWSPLRGKRFSLGRPITADSRDTICERSAKRPRLGYGYQAPRVAYHNVIRLFRLVECEDVEGGANDGKLAGFFP